MNGRFPQSRADVGDAVATFSTYEGAQKAVSTLIAGEIPAKDIAVVGRGLRSIEKVTGRLGYAAAARSGAVNGLLLGLLFSAIFVLGTPNVAIQLFIGVMFVGIAIGMLMSIVVYSFVRRRRDYASVTQVVADSYDVTVLPTSIHRARQVLGRGDAASPVAAPEAAAAPPRPADPSPAPPADAPPPQYGERVTPPRAQEPPRYGERVTPAPTPGSDDPVPPATVGPDASPADEVSGERPAPASQDGQTPAQPDRGEPA